MMNKQKWLELLKVIEMMAGRVTGAVVVLVWVVVLTLLLSIPYTMSNRYYIVNGEEFQQVSSIDYNYLEDSRVCLDSERSIYLNEWLVVWKCYV